MHLLKLVAKPKPSKMRASNQNFMNVHLKILPTLLEVFHKDFTKMDMTK